MKVRDLFLIGATVVSLSAPVFAADSAPLPAGGPAAQSEGALNLDNWVWYAGVGGVIIITAAVLSSNDSSAATTTH